MKRRVALTGTFFSLGLLFGASCTVVQPPAGEGPCLPECRAGFACASGKCVSECNPDCGAGQTCVAGECVDSASVKLYDYEDASGNDYIASGGTWSHLDLSYSIDNLTPDMAAADQTNAIVAAMNAWANACPELSFVMAPSSAQADVHFSWASGDHGDGYSFDGGGTFGGNVLAHAFFPETPREGDLHFDEFETWSLDGASDTIHLRAVAIHELGHTLGLDHSSDKNSIMYPYYRPDVTTLGADDVAGIQAIYSCTKSSGCGDGTCSESETCGNCPADCGCSGGEVCQQGWCVDSVQCGDGLCDPGETCSSCSSDCGCTNGYVCSNGTCIDAGPVCGDSVCDPGETCSSCSSDCGCTNGYVCSNGTCIDAGPVCGDSICEGNESCGNCATDCGCSGGLSCQGGQCVAVCDYYGNVQAADYACTGGIVMNIQGSLDASGNVSISATKVSGTFGNGDYRVLVFDPNDGVSSNHCQDFNVNKKQMFVSGNPTKITFPTFPSLLVCGGPEKAYCVTKLDGGDVAYWCSNKYVAGYQ